MASTGSLDNDSVPFVGCCPRLLVYASLTDAIGAAGSPLRGCGTLETLSKGWDPGSNSAFGSEDDFGSTKGVIGVPHRLPLLSGVRLTVDVVLIRWDLHSHHYQQQSMEATRSQKARGTVQWRPTAILIMALLQQC